MAASAAEPCDRKVMTSGEVAQIFAAALFDVGYSVFLQSDKNSSSSLEVEPQTPPTTSQETNQSQPGAPFYTPELGLRKANGVPAQLSYDSPVCRTPPTAAAGTGRFPWQQPPSGSKNKDLMSWFPFEASGSAALAAVSSSLSQNIADMVGQDGAAPLTSLQIHFIQNMIHETLDEFR